MGFTYRIATPDDRNDYIDFINYVFSHDHQPHDFKALLPKEYGDGRESRATHFMALNDAGRIRGVVAALPFDVRVLDRSLRFAYIGSVSVHPYARGEGHMKKLMSMVQDWLIGHQVDVAVLGGLRQRYQYFGYSKGGLGIHYTLNSDNVRHGLKSVDTAGYEIREITQPDDALLPELQRLHGSQSVHVPRDAERFFDIGCSWYNRLYAALRDGVCVGYLSAGENGSIVELVADPDAIPAIAKVWMARTGAARIDILVQPHQKELLAFLNGVAEDLTLTAAENLRIFHWENVLPAYLALKRELNGISDGECSLRVDGTPIHISCAGGCITLDDRIGPDAPEFSNLTLQEAVFSHAALLSPASIGGAPKDWFPLALSIAPCDGF